jgi:hypothetical protein
VRWRWISTFQPNSDTWLSASARGSPTRLVTAWLLVRLDEEQDTAGHEGGDDEGGHGGDEPPSLCRGRSRSAS